MGAYVGILCVEMMLVFVPSLDSCLYCPLCNHLMEGPFLGVCVCVRVLICLLLRKSCPFFCKHRIFFWRGKIEGLGFITQTPGIIQKVDPLMAVPIKYP